MKCENPDCKSVNRIGIDFCDICILQRTEPNFKGHPDQTFGHITYSQTGEDIVVANLIFKLLKLKNANYLDLGAYHPFHISNTALLYKHGLRGVVVEANPNLIENFKIHRQEDVILNCAVVDDDTKEVSLYMYDRLSGRNSTVEGYMESDPYGPLQTHEKISVPAININDIIRKYFNSKSPTFLSVDIEGMDLRILNAYDYKKFGYPSIVCVEALTYGDATSIIGSMLSFGYRLYLRLSINLIFVHYRIESLIY